MNPKDKSFDKFKNDLKQFFKANKNVLAGNSNFKYKEEFAIPKEIELELTPDFPINTRIKTLRNLSEVVLQHKLEEYAVEKICHHTEDILRLSTKEYRHTLLYFYQCLVQGQYLQLKIMRVYFFIKIKTHDHIDDTIPKFELFQKLTDYGKDISFFEEEVGIFLLNWMPVIIAAGKASDFLEILVNYIKYNASYIDEDIINGIVQNSAYVCCESDVEEVVLKSLDVLDAIIRYSTISQPTMTIFISALSRAACMEIYNAASWKIMRNLLGSHMGHFCLQTLCKMLQDQCSYDDIGLVVGMIFNINMALLNNKPDFIIGYIPNFIIPSVFKASQCNSPLVLLEVTLCLRWLIEKYGKELKDATWERLYVIINTVISKISNSPRRDEYKTYLNELFLKISALLENNQFKGDIPNLFRLIYQWYNIVPEPLIIQLIDYSVRFIVPVETSWLENLHILLSSYYEKETRTDIRLYTLKEFHGILMVNRYLYEKTLINNCVSPFFSNVAFENDPVVCNAAIKFLLQFAQDCSPAYMGPMLDILEKVLQAPFENDEIAAKYSTDCTDIQLVLKGLIDIFSDAIYHLPSSNAIKVVSMLVTFLQNHYRCPHIFESFSEIRLMVIDWLLKLRADSRYRLGFYTKSRGIRFSSYLVIEHRRPSNISLSALPSLESRSSASSFDDDFDPTDMTYISLSDACQALVAVLKNELDWNVLHHVLQALPTAMQYKALIISRFNCDIDPLIKSLTSLLSEGNLPGALKNTPTKFSKPEFYCKVIPVLSSFVSHSQLDLTQQMRLIQGLEICLVYKSAHKCIPALMICLIEMKEAMVKLLPEVILNLSKISPSKLVAIPMLEFLSMLATCPKVFVNFTSKQYMSIFAIIFPYTNPFKYHHYTVSLAHHVIAVWYLRCRRPLRRDFVKYIITGLKTNALSSFPTSRYTSEMNEDSSSRKRSSSLTEQGNRKKERHMSTSGRLLASRNKSDDDEKLILFHRELTDTCIDMMSRFAFVSCSARPKRHPISNYMFHKGQSMQWLVDKSLITITTSGCLQKIAHKGLCAKCLEWCEINPILLKGSESLAEKANSESIDKDKQTDEKTYDNDTPEQSPVCGYSSKSSPMSSSMNVSGGEERFTPENVEKAKRIITEELELLDTCVCWCQQWAEVHIRKPTGDTSWLTRIQNDVNTISDFDPITDIGALYEATVINEQIKLENTDVDIEKESATPVEVEITPVKTEELNIVLSSKPDDGADLVKAMSGLCCVQDEKSEDSCCHGRNSVRRSNSSPEMSSDWKNTYSKDSSRSFTNSPVSELEQSSSHENLPCSTPDCRKSGKCSAKELRGNCEAIPEEFAGQGSTPPTSDLLNIVQLSSKAADTDKPSVIPTSSSKKSPVPKTATTVLESSLSEEDVNPKSDDRKLKSQFFDRSSMPNENFEFGRSASVSQVVPPFKKTPPVISAINLGLASSQPHLTSKPPLSPPTHITRLMKHGKESPVDSRTDLFSQDFRRSRVHTISVMSSVSRQSEWEPPLTRVSGSAQIGRSGVSPSYIFLQLFNNVYSGNVEPFMVPSTGPIQLAIKNFDRIPPYETHKVGVIYVGPGQAKNETEILRNSYGSIRYSDFLCRLGKLVNLLEVNSQNIFLGGLEQNGNDGRYAYLWRDEIMQVIFHVATLMPNKETDLNCNNKKQHIGNDYVTIVYNDSGEDYDIQTIKSKFNFAAVIIEPLEHERNRLTVKAREDLVELIGNVEPKIVSDKNVSLLARQLALHINLASVILSSSLNQDKSYVGIFASNWLERWRKMKHIKTKVLEEMKEPTVIDPNAPPVPTEIQESKQSGRRNNLLDFSEWTA